MWLSWWWTHFASYSAGCRGDTSEAKPHHLFHMWTFLWSERNRPEILFLTPPQKNNKKTLILTAWIRSTQLPTDVQQPPLLQSFNGYNIRYLFSCHVFGEIQEGRQIAQEDLPIRVFFGFFYDRRRDESGRGKPIVQLPLAGF